MFEPKAIEKLKLNELFWEKIFYLRRTTTASTFQFNHSFYKHIEVVVMGPPLAPAFADICMNSVLDKLNRKSQYSFKIFKYVDISFWHLTTLKILSLRLNCSTQSMKKSNLPKK